MHLRTDVNLFCLSIVIHEPRHKKKLFSGPTVSTLSIRTPDHLTILVLKLSKTSLLYYLLKL